MPPSAACTGSRGPGSSEGILQTTRASPDRSRSWDSMVQQILHAWQSHSKSTESAVVDVGCAGGLYALHMADSETIVVGIVT
jgi:2-polyprenyl-3-methyl-5-hydroxy-6-metoxy-1,4-benzoquinol methylase